MVRLCSSTVGGKGSIPGQGTKIPHAAMVWQKKKKKKSGHFVILEFTIFLVRGPYLLACRILGIFGLSFSSH